jgi:TolB-like protein/DNA-binding winged helix-turn-helix (wHTH) protein
MVFMDEPPFPNLLEMDRDNLEESRRELECSSNVYASPSLTLHDEPYRSRSYGGDPVIYRFDRFQVEDEDFRLSADGEEIALEPKALRVLLHFVRNPGRLIRKQELLDQVWQEANVMEAALTRSIGLLRKALEEDSREPRFIQTVPTAGYRFIAEVSVLDKATPANVLPEPDLATTPEPVPRRHTLLLSVLTGTVALLVLAGVLVREHLRIAAPIRSLAVLPLENLSGDPSQEYFADGMTDELITELARIHDLRVVSRTSVMQDKGSRKSLQQISNELQVDAIVEGSIVRSGDKVRITAQLIDARSDRHLWAQSFEGQSSDIVALQDSVAKDIAAQARVVLMPEAGQHTPSHNVGEAAHDAYLRGRYFFGKGEVSRSADYFRQAIALEPSYASAYAGLADALDAETALTSTLPEVAMPTALAAAQHAIQLDPENGEAYTALGSVQTIYEWNWPEAERNLTRGIALSPSYSLAEMKYAVYLDAVGRPEDAVTHMRRALNLDPLSFFMNRRLGATLYLARDYDAAIDQLQRAAEMEPEKRGVVDNYIGLAYEMKGMHDQAVDHDLAALHNDWPKLDVDGLRLVYERKGWDAYWRARIDALQQYDARGCMDYEVGLSYLRIGERDRAFSFFSQAIDRSCYRVVWMKVDPLLDSIRSDPRYARLLQRVNLGGPRS